MCFGCEFIDVVDVLALLPLGRIKGGGGGGVGVDATPPKAFSEF